MHWKMGVENDKKDFDLAYLTQHITLWFLLKHCYSMSWYFDAFLHVGFMHIKAKIIALFLMHESKCHLNNKLTNMQ